MILACLIAASQLAPVRTASQAGSATTPRAEDVSPAIRLEPKDGSGLLVLWSDGLPGESFTFVTCEALVRQGTSTELFPMKIAAKDWKGENGRWSYTWDFDGGLRLEFSATADVERGGSAILKYTLTNGSSETLKHVMIFPCLPSLGAPSFYPGTAEEAKGDTGGRKARVGRHDYSELYARLSLFASGKPFAFADSKLAADEKHLAFMKTGEPPLDWSWFVNAEKTFDVPLIVESSRDKKFVIGLSFDHGVQASSNVGDGRACIHVVPVFAEIPAGRSATTVGRFYWMRGEPESLLARFHKDFPTPVKD
jgi:hypothetical protein